MLHEAIGWYIETRLGLFTLGVKLMKVWFIEGGKEPVLRQWSTATVMESFILECSKCV